jgi:multiple sugar transport system substrate-binding protein
MRRSIGAAIGAGVLATALALTGCTASGGANSSTSASGGDLGSAAHPVKLTYWGWAPNMDKVVAKYNATHKNIQVNYVKTDAGDPAVTKFLTAIKAGSGAPDLMQSEYQKIPTLVSANAIIDISKDVSASTLAKFSKGVLSNVTLGSNALYGVPQDSGPMMFYYRSDVFAKLGLSAPTTWAEYAADAAKIHAANPSDYLGTFSSADAGEFAGLTQQAGASWWGSKGSSWSVAIDSAASTKVASFWGGLVQSGAIDNEPQYTPAWNKGLADGTQVGWVSAVWAPGVLEGSAPATAGKWKMAPLPQWSAGDDATGNWGGSAVAVSSQSKHVAAAVSFDTWLNTSPTAVSMLVGTSALYPADTVDSKSALASGNSFFSNQPDFYTTAAKIAETVKPFTYGPNVNVAYSAFNDQFGKAAQSKSQAAFVSALQQMQKITVSDLKSTGFTVTK